MDYADRQYGRVYKQCAGCINHLRIYSCGILQNEKGNELIAAVAYVSEGGPAEKAGMKRGGFD